MGEFYNDNSVPFGSRTEVIKRGGTGSPTDIGTFVCEHISLTQPSHIGERKNEIGKPNGWWAVEGFDHGTCVIQIPTLDQPYPKRGDWFQDTFGEGEEEETWAIVEITKPFAMADYYKANGTIRRALHPPA